MGWAKRFWSRKEHAAGGDAAQEAWQRVFDPKLADRLGSVEGCFELIELLDKYHKRAARDLVGEDAEVQEVVMALSRTLARDEVELVFEEVEAEMPRALLAQTVLCFYAWDLGSVVFTTMDFGEQLAECLVIGDLMEELSQATGEGLDQIRGRLPKGLHNRVVCYGLLDAMDRPLGLLAPELRARDLDLPLAGVRLDGLLIERDLGSGGPGREVILQSEPAPEVVRAVEEAGHRMLSFTVAEVLGSFRAGARVVEHVVNEWGWRARGEQ